MERERENKGGGMFFFSFFRIVTTWVAHNSPLKDTPQGDFYIFLYGGICCRIVYTRTKEEIRQKNLDKHWTRPLLFYLG